MCDLRNFLNFLTFFELSLCVFCTTYSDPILFPVPSHLPSTPTPTPKIKQNWRENKQIKQDIQEESQGGPSTESAVETGGLKPDQWPLTKNTCKEKLTDRGVSGMARCVTCSFHGGSLKMLCILKSSPLISNAYLNISFHRATVCPALSHKAVLILCKTNRSPFSQSLWICNHIWKTFPKLNL